MKLNINLDLDMKLEEKNIEKTTERVKKAIKKADKSEPTWEEVWVSGYGNKKGIFQSKVTELDKTRLMQVKAAIEDGEIGSGVDSLRKFSKAHALNLYKHLKEVRRDGIIADMIKNKPCNYHLVTTLAEFTNVLEMLVDETVIGLDTETTGVDYDVDYIVGISMTLPMSDYHCYIPIRHNLHEGYTQLDANTVLQGLKPFLESTNLGKVLHNAKFDSHMFYREKIDLKNIVMDTMIAAHVLNENEPSFALKNLATKYGKYFGFDDKSMTYEELFGKGGFQDTPLDIGTIYACKDTHLCYNYYKWIHSMLEQNPNLYHVYYKIENPVLEVAIEMERNGFQMDLEFAKGYLIELNGELELLEKKLKEYFGDINVDSNQQLAEFLYDVKGIEPVSGRSVDKTTLKAIADQFEGVKVLLEYRGLKKLVSTYIEPLPQKIWNRDGRLHGNFNQTGTATGRFASNNPNLQNLPYGARKMIVAPKGKVILGKDFSQIEPRILAFMSKDKEFQRPYVEGTDLYSTLASKVFHKAIEECGDGTKERKMMKVGLLASMYGTSPFTLSQQLGITVEEGIQFLEDFLSTYPDARDYMQSLRDKADAVGYVETLYGRKRRFIGHTKIAAQYHSVCGKIKKQLGTMPSNIWSEKKLSRELKQAYWEVSKEYGRASRQAVNSVIQGSAADVMKIAMVQVLDFLRSKGPEWKLIATIHDEILIEVPDTFTEQDIIELDARMTKVYRFDFPVKTDTVVFTRWGENEISVKDYLQNRSK